MGWPVCARTYPISVGASPQDGRAIPTGAPPTPPRAPRPSTSSARPRSTEFVRRKLMRATRARIPATYVGSQGHIYAQKQQQQQQPRQQQPGGDLRRRELAPSIRRVQQASPRVLTGDRPQRSLERRLAGDVEELGRVADALGEVGVRVHRVGDRGDIVRPPPRDARACGTPVADCTPCSESGAETRAPSRLAVAHG